MITIGEAIWCHAMQEAYRRAQEERFLLLIYVERKGDGNGIVFAAPVDNNALLGKILSEDLSPLRTPNVSGSIVNCARNQLQLFCSYCYRFFFNYSYS